MNYDNMFTVTAGTQEAYFSDEFMSADEAFNLALSAARQKMDEGYDVSLIHDPSGRKYDIRTVTAAPYTVLFSRYYDMREYTETQYESLDDVISVVKECPVFTMVYDAFGNPVEKGEAYVHH